MNDGVGALLAAYDEQVRGYVPSRAPVGAVVEKDGPAVRTHYGTHGTVAHRPLDAASGQAAVAALIGRQQAVSAARHEPLEWRAYGHDRVRLDGPLRAAGFTAGAGRSLLTADPADLPDAFEPPRGRRVRTLHYGDHRVAPAMARAADGGPYRRPLAELLHDHGGLLGGQTMLQVLDAEMRPVGVGWAAAVDGTRFVVIDGMTGAHPEFLPAWASWARRRASHLVAEVPAGPVEDALLAAGFRAATTVRTYRWTPEGSAPAATRPVTMVVSDPDHVALCTEFGKRFDFRPSPAHLPGMEEPPHSVTWHVGDIVDVRQVHALLRDVPGDHPLQRVQAVVERGLRACARPGEQLYSISWHHQGYRFDPARVGGPGQPRWPGAACWEGDYYKFLARDLRMGTVWNPWEESLCVFGADLLAEVEDDLTAVLRTVLRRGGRNTGHVWTYESKR